MLRSYHTSTALHTPIHGGVPLVIPGLLTGSIGCTAVETATKKPVLLSNQHAFFPVVNGKKLPVGTKIFQKGDSTHPVAQTYKTIAEPNPWPAAQGAEKMKTIGIYHDSALAEALIPITNWINGIGKVNGIANPKKGMKVKFYGATSALQKGTITNPSNDVLVPSGNNVSVRKGLVSMDITSAPGDSGSLVVSDPDNKAVGLLFGSAGGQTGAGNIARIAQVYGLEIGGQSPVTPLPTPTPTPTPTPQPTGQVTKIQDILLEEINIAGHKAPVWLLGGGLVAGMSILMVAAAVTGRR